MSSSFAGSSTQRKLSQNKTLIQR